LFCSINSVSQSICRKLAKIGLVQRSEKTDLREFFDECLAAEEKRMLAGDIGVEYLKQITGVRP